MLSNFEILGFDPASGVCDAPAMHSPCNSFHELEVNFDSFMHVFCLTDHVLLPSPPPQYHAWSMTDGAAEVAGGARTMASAGSVHALSIVIPPSCMHAIANAVVHIDVSSELHALLSGLALSLWSSACVSTTSSSSSHLPTPTSSMIRAAELSAVASGTMSCGPTSSGKDYSRFHNRSWSYCHCVLAIGQEKDTTKT